MKDFIKTFTEGKATGATTMTISDDGVIVLFKKEYELDNKTYPPTVKEKADTVQKTFTQDEIDVRIAELQEEIDLLQGFKNTEVTKMWTDLGIGAKIAAKAQAIEDAKLIGLNTTGTTRIIPDGTIFGTISK